MRLRTVSSIILPSAHKVKASARNSVTTVVGGGGEGERRSGGLLKESPEPPRTFLEFFWGGGGWRCRKGACPRRGACPCAALVCSTAALPCRGARLFWSPAAPAFSFLSCPHPPYPLPGGKGENITLFRRGLPPPAPRALNRLRHLQSLPSRYPAGGFASCEAGLGWRSDTRRGVAVRTRYW